MCEILRHVTFHWASSCPDLDADGGQRLRLLPRVEGRMIEFSRCAHSNDPGIGALANSPIVLLLDEPTSALDEGAKSGVETLIRDIIRESHPTCGSRPIYAAIYQFVVLAMILRPPV